MDIDELLDLDNDAERRQRIKVRSLRFLPPPPIFIITIVYHAQNIWSHLTIIPIPGANARHSWKITRKFRGMYMKYSFVTLRNNLGKSYVEISFNLFQKFAGELLEKMSTLWTEKKTNKNMTISWRYETVLVTINLATITKFVAVFSDVYYACWLWYNSRRPCST